MDPMHLIFLLMIAFLIPIAMLIERGISRLLSHARNGRSYGGNVRSGRLGTTSGQT